MKQVAMVLCLCILQGGEGLRVRPGLDAVLGTIRRLRSWKLRLLSESLKWVTEAAKFVGVVIGKYVIKPPLLGAEAIVNTHDTVKQMGINLLKSLVRVAKEALQQGWGAVQTLKLPGWKYIMVFPNSLVSIVDKAANTAWYLVSKTGKKIVAGEAFMIYSSLDVVSKTIGPAMRLLNLNCVTMHKIKQKIDTFVVDELQVAKCEVCGVSHLEAVSNVTITSEGKSFMIVEIPYLIKDIQIKIAAANVTDYSDYLLKNTPLTVTIKKTKVKGQVYFTRGTLLKFITIKLRVVDFVGFNIKVDVGEEERTYVMDVVEEISDVLASKVKDTVNNKFEKLEKKFSDIITGS